MLQQRIPDPCALVIFGASGDLTRRKLVPAIWHLHHQERLPQAFHLVGVARREWDDDLFRQKMRESLAEFVGPLDDSTRDVFLAKFHYVRGDPGDPATYAALKARLEALDRECGTEGNRCFYCSVPPQIYRDIVEQLGRAGPQLPTPRPPRLVPDHRRKALRPQLRLSPRTQPSAAFGLCRRADLPHRPLPRQGDRAEHPRLSPWQFNF